MFCPNKKYTFFLIVFGLVFLGFFSFVSVARAELLCDICNEIEQCCDGNSWACIGGKASCTVDGLGFPDQYCSECEGNYQSCDMTPGGIHEIRWCGEGSSGPQGRCIPSGITAAPLSCDGGPGSFNQTDGFVYKQYANVHIDDNYENRIVNIGFTCSPFSTVGYQCSGNPQLLTATVYYEGYFQADEDTYYQFATQFSPVAYVYLDVNGNGTFDDNGNTYGYPFSYWTVLYGHCCNDNGQCSACYPPLQPSPGWEGEWDWRVSPLLSRYATDPYHWTSSINPQTLEAGVNGPKMNEVLLKGIDSWGVWPADSAIAYSNSIRYLTKGPHKIAISYWNNSRPSPYLQISYRKLSVPALLQRPDTDYPKYNSEIKPLGVSKEDYINTALVRNNGWYYANKPDWIPFNPDCSALNAAAGVDRLVTVCSESTSITGTLFDASENDCSTIDSAPKLPGVTVIATDTESGQVSSATSNASGVYKMGVKNDANYNLSFLTSESYDNNPIYACEGTTASFIDEERNETTTVTRNFGFLPTSKVPWFQIKDSDMGSNGTISSKIPSTCQAPTCFPYFDLVGDGGFPGVVIHKSSVNFGRGEVSEEGWIANAGYSNTRVYSAGYYIGNIPSDAVVNSIPLSSIEGNFFSSGGTPTNGYYWYLYDGSENAGAPLTITSGVDLGERKVVLMVKNADINIQGNINLTRGQGFFLGLTTGDINISPLVGGGDGPNLEGVYIADGTFHSGSGGVESDIQLKVRGSVAGHSGISLERDVGELSNPTTPSELFEYAPDQELLFPVKLSYKPSNWREVAP